VVIFLYCFFGFGFSGMIVFYCMLCGVVGVLGMSRLLGFDLR